MFKDTDLENALKYNHTIESNQAVWLEWNLNQSYNIDKVGNYRYRPGTVDPFYGVIRNIYEANETVTDTFRGYYTGATDSDIIIDAGIDDDINDPKPSYLLTDDKKINLIYSLEDCFKQNRPRSGINKLIYLGNVSNVVNHGSYSVAEGQYIDSLNSFKQLKTAVITNASSSGGLLTYTAEHNFVAGDYVKITGIANYQVSPPITSDYNFVDPQRVLSVTSNTFSIAGSTAQTYTSGGAAEVGYLSSVNVARRPRYYMGSRYDDFRYWTSYREEVSKNADGSGTNEEYGIARNETVGNPASYYIYDAAPFVVYKEKVPANRVTVKMQTNVGEVNNGPYRIGNIANVLDPLYGDANRTVPIRWAIQKLNADNEWVEIISFNESSVRSDGSQIIGSDGHVEIEYGLSIPDQYAQTFLFAGEISSLSLRPDLAPEGYAYLYKESETDKGTLFISDGGNWVVFPTQYEWKLSESDITRNTKVIKQLTNPHYYVENNEKVYRDFEFLYGLRVVAETMNRKNSTFDLIELSPRLVADISDKTISYSISKTLSDLGSFPMPMGNLIASTGQMSLFDDDLAFNENNTFDEESNLGSIISQYSNGRLKFTFYDIVKNINSYDYYIPVKTMYSEKMPQVSDTAATLNVNLRDLFFLLESKKSPELLLTNVSLSYAVMVLLDNIGFSNYKFNRLYGEDELIIPYFFVGPDQNVAETLQQLAVSSQSAMFFDEYNDLVVMSKNYLLPSSTTDRRTDLVLYGQEEADDNGIALPNIINLASQEKLVYNGGEINYTTRYIQKSIGSIAQAPYSEEYKTYVYKPSLLWEIAGQENVRTVNESATQSSGYSLSAMPLKTALTSSVPVYSDGQLLNNIMDFGENIYWLANYSGYFYANGEIIRYDAVEYSVAGVGNVWITNNHEYQSYFARLKFNGKMYPTGRVRIYAKVSDGAVKEHGRAQFGTTAVEHTAGIEGTPWTDVNYVRGSIQNAKQYLFNTNDTIVLPDNSGIDEAGNKQSINGQEYVAKSYADNSSRNGIIKNFMANTTITENDVNAYKTAYSGSVQTSALVFSGPATIPSVIDPANFLTYVYKPLDKPFRHFGTRMRIIGRIETGSNKAQTAIGSFDLYSFNAAASEDPDKQVSISGGSGGVAFGLNKDTNVGYYFEIAALNQDKVSSYKNNSNGLSYSILESASGISVTNDLVTIRLKEQHALDVGSIVVVSGVIDDNNKDKPTRISGEFTVTQISQDRKSFQYELLKSDPLVASVTAAVADGSKIVYTSNNHNFSAGQHVTIAGFANTTFNLVNAVITAVDFPVDADNTFTVESAIPAQSQSGQTATATYLSLTTTSSTGGTVFVQNNGDTTISDVFFYKVVSGSNQADILKKQRVADTVTLTTLRDHSLSVGESVTVSGVGSGLDGTFIITAIGDKSFEYKTTTSGTVSLTTLSPLGLAVSNNKVAIPQLLWRGLSGIIVDDGKFTTQSRLNTSEKTTVYDLSAEYVDSGSIRTFYLYLNDKQVAVVDDTDPLPIYGNMALFVRGTSRIMFENVFALSDDFANNTAKTLQLPISKAFGEPEVTGQNALRKYAISGMVQNTYLSGVSSESTPKYILYYDEFGTIMREAAYFNIRYDRAFPALYSQLAPTLNSVRGYTKSGFYGWSYGAEFLIFNAIDKNLNLDDTTGNYLRILGIAFTQNTTHSLKLDDFFKKNSNFVNSIYNGTNSDEYRQLYTDILNSRNKYGRNDFALDTQYVQTDAAAESMMEWIVKKIVYPRKAVGVNTFGTPHLQLGDIVEINYKNSDNIDIVAPSSTRFVVYNIQYQKSNDVTTTVYLAEV
jgi:hypothetical protein